MKSTKKPNKKRGGGAVMSVCAGCRNNLGSCTTEGLAEYEQDQI